jgi:hypothetical protein
MKIMQVTSWVFLALEVFFIALLFANPNVGDDAAGRGVGRGYGLVLAPFVLLCAGLLYWSQHSSSNPLRVAAFGVVAIPFLIGAVLFAGNSLQEWSYRLGAARAGQFSDPHLTKIARAIDQKNYAAERALLGEGKIDWDARDGTDATLLGHAVKRVLSDYGADPPVEGVRILLATGAPLTDSATRPDEHLMETVFDGNSPGTLAMMKAFLEAGGDANAKDRSGLPLIHTTTSSVPKLALLAEHGADLNAPSNRFDRPKWTPLMNAVYMRQWDQALFLIENGGDISYQATDGNTLALVLEDRVKEYKLESNAEAGYAQFVEALHRRSGR